MKVKICGITNLEDALNAINCGADALGFVFYEKSPRYITPELAKKIIDKLPPLITYVGLFVNIDANAVNHISKISGISLAQIHFDASREFYENLDIKHIKVIRAKNKGDIQKYTDEYKIVDAYVGGYGGEGKRLDLGLFKGIDTYKIILAGGLNPDNINELKEYNFFGVDVSSGVEIAPGEKDINKMKSFIINAHSIKKSL